MLIPWFSLKPWYLAECAFYLSAIEHFGVSAILQRNHSVNVENSANFTKYLNRDWGEQVLVMFSQFESQSKWHPSREQMAQISQQKSCLTLVLLCSTLLKLTLILDTKMFFKEVFWSNFVQMVPLAYYKFLSLEWLDKQIILNAFIILK